MHSFVDKSVKKMPHKSRNKEDRYIKTLLAIPKTYKQLDIPHDVNKTLESMCLQAISSRTFNRILKKEKKEVKYSNDSQK